MWAFAHKGTSNQTIALLVTFLSNRTMIVKVDNTWFKPLPVFGGVPQGSVLGVMLFNIAKDDLKNDQDDPRVFLDRLDEPETNARYISDDGGNDSCSLWDESIWHSGFIPERRGWGGDHQVTAITDPG